MILLSLVFLFIGCLIGYLVVTKTKLLDKLSKGSREIDKIISDPEQIKKKLEESAKKLNPDAEGTPQYVDRGTVLNFEVEEKDGKKELVIKKSEYVPTEKDKKREEGFKKMVVTHNPDLKKEQAKADNNHNSLNSEQKRALELPNLKMPKLSNDNKAGNTPGGKGLNPPNNQEKGNRRNRGFWGNR